MSEYATGSLDTEGQRADVNQDEIFSALLTGENTTLDSGTISDSFIEVDTLRWFFAEVLLQELLNLGNTS
jgi:hypothetical protein